MQGLRRLTHYTGQFPPNSILGNCQELLRRKRGGLAASASPGCPLTPRSPRTSHLRLARNRPRPPPYACPWEVTPCTHPGSCPSTENAPPPCSPRRPVLLSPYASLGRRSGT